MKRLLFTLDMYRQGRGAIFRYDRDFEASQWYSRETIESESWRRMVAILDHAYRHIAYYRQSFDRVGIVPSDIRTPEDLLQLPILEKRDVQQHLDSLVADGFSTRDLILDQTGGSTGTPVRYYRSFDRDVSRQAATWRHNRWASWEPLDRSAALWGAARDIPDRPKLLSRLRNFVFPPELIFNTATFGERDVLDFNEAMKRFRPKTILGYANALVVFAKMLQNRGVVAYSPASIVASAEILTAESRRIIEEVFGCRVFNRYGSRETSVIASECDRHEGMHIMAEGLYIELVCDGRHARAGECGEVLVTDLLNLPMPFIRYRIGDTAIAADKPCSCGRGLPMLASLAGRVTDFLVTDDGRLCSGAALTALLVSKCPTLGQAQMIQHKQGEVLLRLAIGSGNTISNTDAAFVREKITLYLGATTRVDFEFVDQIERTASGKSLFSISHAVPKEFAFAQVAE
ncbi:MAG: phenylacetate--CoA ligase family protein [Thermoguttaceae bacterium]